MKKFSFALAALVLLITPFAASAYSSMPYYPATYNGGSMYSAQLAAQAMSLQSQRYYIGTDCTDYGYGDCAQRLARSGSQYGPGWMIMNPQQSYGGYGGGYSGYGYRQYQNQYQPSYYGGGYGYGNNYYGGNAYSGGYGNYYGGGYGGYNPYGSYYGY